MPDTLNGAWCFLEVGGRRWMAGCVWEVMLAGSGFFKVITPEGTTTWFSPQAVYSITASTEEKVRAEWPVDALAPTPKTKPYTGTGRPRAPKLPEESKGRPAGRPDKVRAAEAAHPAASIPRVPKSIPELRVLTSKAARLLGFTGDTPGQDWLQQAFGQTNLSGADAEFLLRIQDAAESVIASNEVGGFDGPSKPASGA